MIPIALFLLHPSTTTDCHWGPTVALIITLVVYKQKASTNAGAFTNLVAFRGGTRVLNWETKLIPLSKSPEQRMVVVGKDSPWQIGRAIRLSRSTPQEVTPM